MGRHTTISKRRRAGRGAGGYAGKALVISLAVVFIIFAVGLVVKVWPKSPGAERTTTTEASRAIKVDKREILEAYNKGEFEAVIPSLEKFVSYNPKDVQMREVLASAYLLTGENKRALNEYQAILKAKPDDPETLYRMGVLLQHMDRTNEAIIHLNKAASKAPNVVLFHAELARANSRARYYKEAVEQWKIVLNLLPPADKARASALAEIANNYILQNEFLLAKEAIANGLKVDPANESLKELEAKIGGQIKAGSAPSPGVTTSED